MFSIIVISNSARYNDRGKFFLTEKHLNGNLMLLENPN